VLALWLTPAGLTGLPAELRGQSGPGVPAGLATEREDRCTPGAGGGTEATRAAAAALEGGSAGRAETILQDALLGCPDHPELLHGLAGLQFRQGHLSEAAAAARHLVRIHPGFEPGWELLGVTLYLQDDRHGALRAWSRGRPRVVRELGLTVLGPGSPQGHDVRVEAGPLTGIDLGDPLTVEGLVRGERRMAEIPAASLARLTYRALPGGQAAVEGTMVLRTRNHFTRGELLAHGVRLLGRRIHLQSVDPTGHLERWELHGVLEGSRVGVGLTLAHRAPGDFGVWRWELEHAAGRFGVPGGGETIREARTSLGWTHTDWLTASLRGWAHTRVDLRPERGTFLGAGIGGALIPISARAAVGAEGTLWTRLGGGAAASGGEGPEARFGRAELRGRVKLVGNGMGEAAPGWAKVGVALHGGVVAVSRGSPRELAPRIGSGGHTEILMRARSDLDDRGVVRPLLPGTPWAHGGLEFLRPLGWLGPFPVGAAVFADAVQLLGPTREGMEPGGGRGAVHLGAGVRTRIPWSDGWLRVDWAVDPGTGGSAFSAAWTREHRLTRVRTD